MSPETAFEELCSQISRSTPPAKVVQFIRNATPDGGVEFYWLLKSKKIVGWQCKFFQGPLTAGQWAQLDKSFNDALNNYPELTEYIVAMPQDLAQGRDKNKKSFRDRWDEHVRNWTAIAKKKKRQIKIEYFGDSDIFNFLSTQEQAGRRWYWFEQTALTQNWFEKRLTEDIANAGARYTPELNIEVPLRKTIEFLTRTEFYRTLLLTHRGKIRKTSRYILGSSYSKFIRKTDLNKLSRQILKLESVLTIAADRELLSVDWQSTRDDCGEVITMLRAIATAVRAKKENQPIPRPQSPNLSDLMGMLLYEIDACISAIYDLIHELDSVSASVSERKSLLITGEAGSGKTHLLCDIARDRIKKGLPTVLLYGEYFQDQEPWNQICRQLQLKDIGCDELLQALESAGQAKQERALIIIDGLNEGVGRSLWRKYLRGMLSTLSNYKWVALAISVRSGFDSYLIDTGTVKDLDLVVRAHFGFADVEFDAIPHFCKHYSLNMPSIPVLVPEFQNPLFLKLTCEGLRATKRRNLPMGISGIKTTFDAFLAAINDKLAKKLELDPKDLLVQKTVEKLSEAMAKNKSSTLPYADAKQIVNQLSNSSKFEDSLFRHLISEGVLAETVRYFKQKREDHVRFAYERFSDHLIVSHLLDGISSAAKLKTAFSLKGVFGTMCANPFANRGLLEALGIQIPERFGLELHTLFPKSLDKTALAQIVLSGLIWREPRHLGKECITFLLDYADRDETFRDLFLDVLVALSPIPDHPLNARFLDRILSRQKLPIRDYIWSTFVSDYATYDRETAVGRIVAWINEHDSSALSSASASLYASVLTWMLATPNRILRDRATKALVRLLQSRIELLVETVKKYADVDDPYIVERLYGIAYGCALRASDPDQLEPLAKYVFNKQFHSGHPQNNILLRDYARGILEIAARGKKIPTKWTEKSTPPYEVSALPAMPLTCPLVTYHFHETANSF